MTKEKYLIKNNLTDKQKSYLLNILNEHGCKNIYLHHAIYTNSEKFSFILPENYLSNNPSFISAYNKANGELHFFPCDNDGISDFNYILYSTNNLLDIGKGIQYLGTDSNTAKWLFNKNINLLSKLLEMNEYYVYALKKENFIKKIDFLEEKIVKEQNIKFCFATSKKDTLKMINLQQGYLYEEMNYPKHLLSEKFVFLNLYKIMKFYRLFFMKKETQVVAKCEWNAFSDKIFQIGGVYVTPSFRKQNFAYTMLFKMLKHSFTNLDMNEASLFVRMSNDGAIKLYEKLQFERFNKNLVWAIFKTI